MFVARRAARPRSRTFGAPQTRHRQRRRPHGDQRHAERFFETPRARRPARIARDDIRRRAARARVAVDAGAALLWRVPHDRRDARAPRVAARGPARRRDGVDRVGIARREARSVGGAPRPRHQRLLLRALDAASRPRAHGRARRRWWCCDDDGVVAAATPPGSPAGLGARRAGRLVGPRAVGAARRAVRRPIFVRRDGRVLRQRDRHGRLRPRAARVAAATAKTNWDVEGPLCGVRHAEY
mmetsp:Transcript_21940/g.87086  ORF Transcript_21940/g.87086 Transcript_21940/m.87086 type:complete len:240 (-) Transcript_21940:79-798(-)